MLFLLRLLYNSRWVSSLDTNEGCIYVHIIAREANEKSKVLEKDSHRVRAPGAAWEIASSTVRDTIPPARFRRSRDCTLLVTIGATSCSSPCVYHTTSR